MKKTLLVTGVNGFVGHHVVHELKKLEVSVIGLGQDIQPTPTNADLLAGYVSADLTDKDAVDAIDLSTFSAVIHLAGLANVGQSFAEPAEFLSANASMSINLLQHALDTKSSARFIVISSGAVYENKQQLPIPETGILTHNSPYSVSKLAVEMMNDYYRSRGVDTVTMRPFNHIGPGQGPGFIVPDLLMKLRAAKANGGPIQAGNLATARDYTDVRDVARAYIAVALSSQKPMESVYNVCSGRSLTGHEILETLAEELSYSSMPEIDTDHSLLRPNDAQDIYGDNTRLKKEFDWKPTISIKQTIKDIVAAI